MNEIYIIESWYLMKRLIVTILKCFLFFIGWAVIVGLTPLPNELNPSIWRFIAEIIPLLGIIIFTVVFYFIEKKAVPILVTTNVSKGISMGLCSGIIWLGLTTGIFCILGIVKFKGVNQVDMLWLWIISTFLNAIMQELLVRGYLYQLIKKKYNITISVIITTALFVFMHGGAISAGIIPVLNIITMSLFMTALLEYTQSIIAPIFAHAFWNIVGAIVLGSVSLASDYPHLINTQFEGNDVLSGGDFMFEGSIIVFILNVSLTILVVFLIKKSRAK